MDLEDLINKSKEGDHDAYRLIIRETSPSVRAFFASRLNDFHTVEDLSQTVFVSAFKSLPSYSGKASFRGWLLRICRNKLMDHLRKQYSQSNLKVAYENEIHNTLGSHGAFENINVEKVEILKKCIQKLPDAAKELVKARYFNFESVTNLAKRLTSSENAISSKLFRLKGKLKTCMESS
ncbi:MAG: sigma-70 family RNA polymerase sigma factor [Lentisphaeraceae bacterium]|nr:sigma-70 family RNA polymerase sigma factor [Lentisphaeraceae bacterium]